MSAPDEVTAETLTDADIQSILDEGLDPNVTEDRELAAVIKSAQPSLSSAAPGRGTPPHRRRNQRPTRSQAVTAAITPAQLTPELLDQLAESALNSNDGLMLHAIDVIRGKRPPNPRDRYQCVRSIDDAREFCAEILRIRAGAGIDDGDQP